MLMQAAANESAPSLSSVVQKSEEIGTTVADALAFLKRAKKVWVTVVTGAPGDWDYCHISKAEARRYLTKSGRKPTDPFASTFEDWRHKNTSLWLGSYYPMRDTAETAVP